MNVLTALPARKGDRAILDWTWSFVLASVDHDSCRLVFRVRADYRPRFLGAFIPFLLEPVHFAMEWKMLRTIERRARPSR
ncbi:MAG: hypothetical protein WKF63_06650 [Thermomicrobiales bacterium]